MAWSGKARDSAMTTATKTKLKAHLRNPERHPAQKRMVESTAKRLIVKAGRRGGKTVGFAIKAVKRFLEYLPDRKGE